VLVRNTPIEESLDRKMKDRWLGPMIVVRESKGGSYILCELDGAVYHKKIAKFRVIPYRARKSIKLPDNLDELLDMSEEKLQALDDSDDIEEELDMGRDYWFDKVRIKSSIEKDDENFD
jgi:hypothetical protein